MARPFSLTATGANTSGYFLVGVTGAATIRPTVYDFMVGSRATPADACCTYDIARTSTAVTGGTTPTPSPLNPTDTAAITTGVANGTGGGTKGVILLSVSVNQRATFRWVAAPGSELQCAQAASGGIMCCALTPVPAAYIVETTLLFWE